MQELINTLKSVDDDYLIGLTNKGIVKRSYKDVEDSSISVEYGENSAVVSVSGEKCTITSSVGDSKCTCPSRNICRHIITAVLWLKKNLSSEQTDNEEDKSKDENHLDNKHNEKNTISEEFTAEMSAFPLKQIQKAMKKQYYSSFISKMEANILPEIQETSIISVKFPNENTSVRLVFPLEYSTCSCHSKDLCKHKAAAILAWQIKHKILNPEAIKVNDEYTTNLDIERIHETAEFSKKFLCDILSGGLVRISDDVSERVESIAIMCHNVRIANSERLMRELGNRIREYVEHSAAFNLDILLSLIMESIVLFQKILNTNDEKKMYVYAGEFKNSYIMSDTLELLPIAQRHFSSMSGYEGEIYYFLNKNRDDSNKFLSYSNVRPTFYENKRRASPYIAPWGLYGSLSDIMGSEIRLKNPKLSGGKISSSSDTKAEIIGKCNLNQSIVYENIYTDFRKMINDIFSKNSNFETEKLVLVSPEKCINSEFDEIAQSHNIIIEDIHNNRLTVKARYKAADKEFFAALKNIGNIMLKNSDKQYVIFANAYIENEKCCLYPIGVFDNIELPKTDEEIQEDNMGEEDYSYFSKLFHHIKSILSDIIQCGINSFDIYNQLKDYSEECCKSGLIILSEKLNRLFEMFDAKNHTYSSNNDNVVSLISEIYSYLSVGIEKIQVNQAINNLYSEEK